MTITPRNVVPIVAMSDAQHLYSMSGEDCRGQKQGQPFTMHSLDFKKKVVQSIVYVSAFRPHKQSGPTLLSTVL